MLPLLLFALLQGCCPCLPAELAEKIPGAKKEGWEGPLSPGLEFGARERKSWLPTAGHGFPQPQAGLHAGQCKELQDGGSVNGPGCATDKLECGKTLIGHTVGGVQRYDSRFYERNFCTPRITNHDGGDERLYVLDMPEGEWTAVVTLDSPCADLDLAALKYNGDDCPSSSTNVTQCEMWPKDGNAREQVRLVSQRATRWFVVVEGKQFRGQEEEGAFSITVQCRKGLM